jgi:sulfur-carrier protein
MKPPAVTVSVGSVLLDYVGGRPRVTAHGANVSAVLDDLETRHPGLRWRVVDEQDRLRPHVALFIAGKPVRDLSARLKDGDELHLLQALSGG